jgi:hypothetical protein
MAFFCLNDLEDLKVLFRAYAIDPDNSQVNEKKAWETAMDLLMTCPHPRANYWEAFLWENDC